MNEFERTGNPFPGLRPFETEEYNLFFGREGQADELLARLGRTRFLAVVGTSGSGKSSLIRAGLIPALYGGMMGGTGSDWRIAVMRPGHDPIGNLACALSADDVLGSPEMEDDVEAAIIETTLRRSTLGLVDTVRQARLPGYENVLVVVDQFEELFRFRAMHDQQGTDDDASAFVKLLLEAPQQRDVPIYIVLTMRSDFLGDCSQFQGLPEAINDGQYLIPRMTRDERRSAITGPASVGGGEISLPLVNRLLNDVGDNPDQLPILQHALMRTWEHWAAHRRDSEPVGLEHYEAVGTMSDALSKHADEAFNELPDERSRHVAEGLFKALTERGTDNRDIRRPTRLSEIREITGATLEEVADVVEVFRREGRSFLMPPAHTALTDSTVIDISHESLIRNWTRLKEWVRDEAESARIYRRLAGAADDYSKGEGGLLDDVTLGWVFRWRDKYNPNRAWGVRYHPEFDAAMAYLEQSREASEHRIAEGHEREQRELERTRAFAEQQTRTARRLRWLSVALGLIMLLALGTAVYAFSARSEAERSRKTAVEERERAVESARVAGQAKEDALEQKAAAKTSEDAARASENAALTAKKRADAEEVRAEKEAARASEQATIAATKGRAEERAAKQARENEKQANEANARGDLMRSGLEASRREDSEHAYWAFNNLITQLDDAVKSAKTQKPGTVADLNFDLGWALSNLGAEQQKLGNFDEAIKSYERARTILTGVLKVDEAALKMDERALMTDEDNQAPTKDAAQQTTNADPARIVTLFETYHGLAHAYHANAPVVYRQSHQPDDERRKREAAQYSNAKQMYELALAFQKKHLSQKGTEIALGRMNLARLYRDMSQYDAAERYYNSAVALQVKELDLANNDGPLLYHLLPEVYSSLREQAEFYRLLPKYDAAVRVYQQLLDIQGKVLAQKNERELPEVYIQEAELANTFSDLGQVYHEMGDEQKANDALDLANLIQTASLKAKQLMNSEDAWRTKLDIDLDRLAAAYVKLERYEEAEAALQAAYEIRQAGPKHNERLLRSFANLANFYRRYKKDSSGAALYYRASIDYYNETPGNDPRSFATVLRQYAGLNADELHDLPKAQELYEQALGLLNGKPGLERDTYATLAEMAALYKKQGNGAKLVAADRQRLKAADALLNSNLPNTVAQKAWDAGAYTEAFGFYTQAAADLSDALFAQGDSQLAGEVIASLLNPKFDTAKVVDAGVLDSYAKTLEGHAALLGRVLPAPLGLELATRIQEAQARQHQIEQIRRQ
jgi:tetratricopeptide (TPR) repeat protein